MTRQNPFCLGIRGAVHVMDLNRVGGKVEFTHLDDEALAFANLEMKVWCHFRFSAWLFYCRRSDSFVGVFSSVSEFNLARTALELTMPTIFARIRPLKKKISMGMDWTP